MRKKLQALSLAAVLALAAVPTFAATPPPAPSPGDHAIPASVLNALFAPAANATPAATNGVAPAQIGSNFYGYCSGDCSPCFSGDHPPCPIDPYTGFTQYCTTIPLC